MSLRPRRSPLWPAGSFVLALALLCAAPRPAHPAQPDPWFGRDKALHFAASAAISGAAWAIASLLTDAPARRAIAAFGAGMLAGVGKEALDAAGLGTPSVKDLLWDAAGAAAGSTAAWALWPAPVPPGLGAAQALPLATTPTEPPSH